MADPYIIAISREYASGGRQISHYLADSFDIPMYDRNIIFKIAEEKGADADVLRKYDEVPKRRLTSRKVQGFSNSPHENVAMLQFDFLRQRAEMGESFVVLGRCAETILNPYNVISIFIMADLDFKVNRILRSHPDLDEDGAVSLINAENRRRKEYHNYYSSLDWGDSRYYDICINASKLGIKETGVLLKKYISARLETGEE